ncbi:MAG: 4Fe-4S binding protein [Dehalococcoidia bacterium]|nr:4Fe-4S binding protein [Dehalococcoidia bacterium]
METESKDKVVFYHRWCKKCGICAAVCSKDALAYDEEGYPYLKNPETCKSCGQCELLCPDQAITVPARHTE